MENLNASFRRSEKESALNRVFLEQCFEYSHVFIDFERDDEPRKPDADIPLKIANPATRPSPGF